MGTYSFTAWNIYSPKAEQRYILITMHYACNTYYILYIQYTSKARLNPLWPSDAMIMAKKIWVNIGSTKDFLKNSPSHYLINVDSS